MKKFSDFENEKVLDGDKIKIEDILNQEIEIIGYKIRNSRYDKNKTGEYLTIQIKMNDKKYIVFTGSDVLIDQLKKHGEKIPFIGTIIKINRYYTLS